MAWRQKHACWRLVALVGLWSSAKSGHAVRAELPIRYPTEYGWKDTNYDTRPRRQIIDAVVTPVLTTTLPAASSTQTTVTTIAVTPTPIDFTTKLPSTIDVSTTQAPFQCDAHGDCAPSEYCDNFNQCYNCDFCFDVFNDAIDG